MLYMQQGETTRRLQHNRNCGGTLETAAQLSRPRAERGRTLCEGAGMTHLDSSTRANNIQVCAPPSNTLPRPEHHAPRTTRHTPREPLPATRHDLHTKTRARHELSHSPRHFHVRIPTQLLACRPQTAVAPPGAGGRRAHGP